MIWQTFFSQPILMRGRDYFRRGKVIRLEADGECYDATVVGSRPYKVHVEESDGTLSKATCDCPHSRSGFYCKHVAAVLCAVDEREREQGNPELQENPFERLYEGMEESGYMYFDMRRITAKVTIYEDTYKRAQRILKGNKLTDFTLDFRTRDGEDNTGMMCEARAGLKDHYGRVVVQFDRDDLLASACDKYVPGFGASGVIVQENRYIPNQYVLALLLLAGEQLRRNPNAGDSTNERGMKLLDSFRTARSADSLTEMKREVSLEPRLVLEDKRYYMTLRAGVDKAYVIKNITDFVNSVENKRDFVTGKQILRFARDVIAESDRALYEFIRDNTADAALHTMAVRNSYFGYSTVEEAVKNRLELFGSRLDVFFDAVAGREISFTQADYGAKKTYPLRFCEAAPDISLEITKDVDKDGVFHGVKASGEAPVFLDGVRHHYFIEGGRFCRVPSEADRRLAPLYPLLENGTFSFRVGRNHLAEFCYTVLPGLRDMIHVRENDPEEIASYLPPEAVMVFYLDLMDQYLTCQGMARYGETELPLSDVMFERADSTSREIHRESEALEVVRRYFSGYDEFNDLFSCERGDDAEYLVLSEGVGELLRIGEVNCTEQFQSLHIRRKVPVKVGVSVSGNLMNLSIESEDVSLKELAAILKSYKQKKRYHRLKNGDFVDIDETVAELSDMVDTLRLSAADLAKGSMKLPAFRTLYLDQMSEKCQSLRIDRDAYFKRIVKEFKTVGESDFDVPEHLRDIMRQYQVFGHRWLRTLEKYGFGGILADDMGLGKTLQVISVMCHAKAEGSAGVSLVVCPASLIYNWLEEIARFAPELHAVAVAGNQSERAGIIETLEQYDVAVTSYDLLKRDIALYENKRFRYEIIDEAQYIKNHNTAAAKAVKVISSDIRFALTGTPIENRLSELWSIFDFLMPGFLYGYETFRKELETPIAKKGDPQATEKLRRMTSPFILRRLKSDVLKDLPDKIEEVRYAAFDTEQRRLYDAQVLHMKGMLEEEGAEDFGKNKIRILAELTRLRRICCDPSLIFENYTGDSAKRAACIDLVKSAIEGEHRILLFSQFTSMLELLEKDLADEGIGYYKITGATPKQERLELVRRFNGDETPVFLISLKAGGTGLNLTGADVVIHYDPWWNVAAQNQATDRAHRIGQTKIVSVYRLIAKNSIEEKILDLQETKQDLADEILSGDLGGIGTLTRDELLSLLA